MTGLFEDAVEVGDGGSLEGEKRSRVCNRGGGIAGAAAAAARRRSC